MIVYVTTGAAIYFALKSPSADSSILREAFLGNWKPLSILSSVLALADLFKDSFVQSRAPDKRDAARIALGLLTGFLDDWLRLRKKGSEATVAKMLPLIEKAAEAVLRQHGVEGTVTANLMVVDGRELHLKHWGTRHSNRDEIRLSLAAEPPPPGAPSAYRSRRVVYVPDTHKAPYADHFDAGRPYRSVLSVPVPFSRSGGPEARAVLNLDSDEPDGFVSDDFVRDHLVPCLHPWLSLLAMEQRL